MLREIIVDARHMTAMAVIVIAHFNFEFLFCTNLLIFSLHQRIQRKFDELLLL